MDELCVVSHLPAPFLFVKSTNGSLRITFALSEFISENAYDLGRQGAQYYHHHPNRRPQRGGPTKY
jgi:hypothetical protein